MAKQVDDLGEVLFEIGIVGSTARVSAIHVPTNTEVIVAVPANLPRFSQQQAALRKLRYVLDKGR